jgi:hypothetical protein
VTELDQLASAYAAAVDGRDWSALAELFAPDAVLATADPPRSLEPVIAVAGRRQIIETVKSLTTFARTFHHVTGSVWTPTGPDNAIGRTTSIAHHVEDGPETHSWVWHVIYQDISVRTDSGWLFARRELTIAMIEKRQVHRVLPFTPPTAG